MANERNQEYRQQEERLLRVALAAAPVPLPPMPQEMVDFIIDQPCISESTRDDCGRGAGALAVGVGATAVCSTVGYIKGSLEAASMLVPAGPIITQNVVCCTTVGTGCVAPIAVIGGAALLARGFFGGVRDIASATVRATTAAVEAYINPHQP